MTCTTKHLTINIAEQSDIKECEETRVSKRLDQLDEESIRYRNYLAQKEALRQLEQMKSRALAVSHLLSFIR